MSKKKELAGFSNFGFSTILLSFVMICVVTFSALSLVTAYSDYKLSKKVATNTQEYYKAIEDAYEKLSQIDACFTDCYFNAKSESDYYETLKEALVSYGTISDSDGQYYLAFSEYMKEDHLLSVKLSLCYPSNDGDPFYEIVEWQSVYITEDPEDTHLNLIQ